MYRFRPITAIPNATTETRDTHNPPPRVSPIAWRVMPDGPAGTSARADLATTATAGGGGGGGGRRRRSKSNDDPAVGSTTPTTSPGRRRTSASTKAAAVVVRGGWGGGGGGRRRRMRAAVVRSSPSFRRSSSCSRGGAPSMVEFGRVPPSLPFALSLSLYSLLSTLYSLSLSFLFYRRRRRRRRLGGVVVVHFNISLRRGPAGVSKKEK